MLIAACNSGPGVGGNSGAEGFSGGPSGGWDCQQSIRLVERDEVVDELGLSPADLVALVTRHDEAPLHWETLDSGPELPDADTTLHLSAAIRARARVVTCDDPRVPQEVRPEPRLEVPVTLSLSSDDGALDERLEDDLVATSGSVDFSHHIIADHLAGTLGDAVEAFYEPGQRRMSIELRLSDDGMRGQIAGPFSPHASNPCFSTAYASWPSAGDCSWDQLADTGDDTEIDAALADLSRTYRVQWSDDAQSELTVEVTRKDGPRCTDNGSATRPVALSIQSADGRIDVSLTGSSYVVGGADPPDYAVSATQGLDADALGRALPKSPSVPPIAIVSFWVGTSPAVDGPRLVGGVVAREVERSAFATALPVGELPGGDSERCFDSAGAYRPPLVEGELGAGARSSPRGRGSPVP